MGILLLILLVMLCFKGSKNNKSGSNSIFDIDNNGKTDLFDLAILSLIMRDDNDSDDDY